MILLAIQPFFLLPNCQRWDNTRAYIVNAEHKLLPAGVEGEICIIGDLVGKGYYQMQSEAFGSCMGERAYDTGDYGMLGFDGNIYYSGV